MPSSFHSTPYERDSLDSLLPCYVPLPCGISGADMNILATYIHDLNPVIISIPGTPLALRWYGLAYVAGFILGYLVLLYLSKRKLYCIEPEKLGDFITWICLIGVLAGGRLGEFFFYWLPAQGWNGLLNDPLWVFRVWEGGMASHGGIIAVVLVALYYAKKHRLSLAGVCDGLAIVCPIGLFFGRLANFINGELYGRLASCDNPIAMKFPQEIYTFSSQKWYDCCAAVQKAVSANPLPPALTNGEQITGNPTERIIELCRLDPTVRNAVEPFLSCRYPSQLFEAAGEGLLLFVILIIVRLGWKNAPTGIFAALFCFLYSAARIGTECFREPDADTWHGITRGQYLSFGVVALGCIFLLVSFRNLARRKKHQKQKKGLQ